MHPLKTASLFSLLGLILAQLSIFVFLGYGPGDFWGYFWAGFLTLPLAIPLNGVLKDRLYTYKWLGFLTLLYFCIGISELVSNPELQIYGLLTTVFSVVLFLSSIYYTRYLRLKQQFDS